MRYVWLAGRAAALVTVAWGTGCYDAPSVDDGTGTDSDLGSTGPSGPGTDATMTNPSDPSDPSAPSSTDPTDPTDPSGPTDSGDVTGEPPVACEAEGTPDPACPADAPFCIDGACAGCDDAPAQACASTDPATPVCDASTGACVGCDEHDQCASGACRIATGECFSEDNRLWVDAAAANCAAGTGTMAAPFCDVVTAMNVLNGQVGEDPWAIFVAGNPNAYMGVIDPNGGRPIAIIGPNAGLEARVESAGFTIDLWAQSPETYVSHVTVASTGQVAVRGGGQDCVLWLDDSAVTDVNTGIETGGCTINARRSVFTNHNLAVHVGPNGTFNALDSDIGNGQGGLSIEGTSVIARSLVHNHYTGGGITLTGDLTLVNSMLYSNEYANDGLDVQTGGTFSLLYTTLVGAITCTNPGPSSIRNSIVLNHASEAGQTCTSASVDRSVVNMGDAQGEGNVLASPTDLPAIFVAPSLNDADYHLLPTATIPDGVAQWERGLPPVDIDGDPRPDIDGVADWAGADVP